MSLIYLQIALISAAYTDNEWFTGVPSMPGTESSHNMICGHYNQSIWLLGYFMLEFQLTDMEFIVQSDLIPNTTVTGTVNKTDSWRPWGYAQYWTQIEHTLYYIYTDSHTEDDWILSYDLQQQQFGQVDEIRP
eukprot:281467_1